MQVYVVFVNNSILAMQQLINTNYMTKTMYLIVVMNQHHGLEIDNGWSCYSHIVFFIAHLVVLS